MINNNIKMFYVSLLCLSLQVTASDEVPMPCGLGSCTKLSNGLYISVLHVVKNTGLKASPKAVAIGETKNQQGVSHELIKEGASSILSQCLVVRYSDDRCFVVEKNENTSKVSAVLHYEPINAEKINQPILSGDCAVLLFTKTKSRLRKRLFPRTLVPFDSCILRSTDWVITFTDPVIDFKQVEWVLPPKVMFVFQKEGMLVIHKVTGGAGMSGGLLWNDDGQIVGVLSCGFDNFSQTFCELDADSLSSITSEFALSVQTLEFDTIKITLEDVLIISLTLRSSVEEAFLRGMATLAETASS